MKKILKSLLYVLAAIGALYVGVAAYFGSGLVNTCREERITVATSPNGARTASINTHTCTKANNSSRLMLNISEPNVPTMERAIDLGAATTSDIALTWRADDELEVIVPASFQISDAGSSLDGIRLVFRRR